MRDVVPPVTGFYQPTGCPCPRCSNCGCGVTNCVNRLGPEPETLVCACPWVELGDLNLGQCFQDQRSGLIWVVYGPPHKVSGCILTRFVFTTDGEDSELGAELFVLPTTLVKPMTFSIPVPNYPPARNPEADWTW